MTLKTMKRKGIAMRKNLRVNCDEEKSARKLRWKKIFYETFTKRRQNIVFTHFLLVILIIIKIYHLSVLIKDKKLRNIRNQKILKTKLKIYHMSVLIKIYRNIRNYKNNINKYWKYVTCLLWQSFHRNVFSLAPESLTNWFDKKSRR